MKNKLALFLLCFVGMTMLCPAQDTDFSKKFTEVWKSKNPEKIIKFTETELEKNRSIETLFARGMVLNLLEQCPHGGIAHFDEAIEMAKADPNYSDESKLIITKSLEASKMYLMMKLQLLGNPKSTAPKRDRKSQDVILSHMGNEVPFPFSETLKNISHEIGATKGAQNSGSPSP